MRICNNSNERYTVAVTAPNGKTVTRAMSARQRLSLQDFFPDRSTRTTPFVDADRFKVIVKHQGLSVRVALNNILEKGFELDLLGPTPHTWVILSDKARKKAYVESEANEGQMEVVVKRIQFIQQGRYPYGINHYKEALSRYSAFECISGDLVETGFMTSGQMWNAYKRVLKLEAVLPFFGLGLDYLRNQSQPIRDWSKGFF